VSLRGWIAGLSLLASACASSPRVSSLSLDDWIELRTPLFSIVTHVPREEALHQANQLISFTEVLREQMDAGRVEPTLPLRIYIFAGWKEYGNFAFPGAAGYTVPRLQGSLLALSLQQPAQSKETLFHEYVHYLMFNGQRFAYPTWYNEGLAEFLGATLIRGDVAFIGAPPLRFPALSQGRETPLETLLGKGYAEMDGREANHFYADAWLLVDYVHVSSHVGGPERLTPTLDYLALLNRGVAWREAFERAFPVGLDELERELDTHLERLQEGAPGFSMTLDDPRPEIRERALGRVEASTLLLELAVTVGNTPLARGLAREALRGDALNARALALSAEAAAAEEDFGAATRDAERAVELAPDAAWSFEAQGSVWAARAEYEPESAQAHLARARASFQRAAELSPEVPSGWAGLGATYLEAEDCESLRAGISALERAHSMAPWDPNLNLELAQIHARAGQPEQARKYAQFVQSVSHHPRLLERADEILGKLEASSKTRC
jgi:tetratricopeptide (TPR) repeat protein